MPPISEAAPISLYEPVPPLDGGAAGRASGSIGLEAGAPVTRTHILTVALEDYFHVTPLQTVIEEDRWYRFEMRLEGSTKRTLDLLDECGARATFFVLGWVADAAPELVREVVSRGHEVASKGYHHRSPRRVSKEEFRDDALRAREALERATGRQVLGYRLAQDWLRPTDTWALEILAAAGYRYDSSVRLLLRTYARERWRQFPYRTTVGGRPFLEVPLSSIRVLGIDVPIAGGNYFRQFPAGLVRRAVAHWDRHYSAPYVMYFHTWELDPDQPRVNGVPWSQQVRQYRNLRKMPGLVRHYLETYRFTSVAEYFQLDASEAPAAIAQTNGRAHAVAVAETAPKVDTTKVTVVVPCFNEEQSLRYLGNTLRSVADELGGQYGLSFIFVDDCSSDRTWDVLHEVFGRKPNCRFFRHSRNLGVAAAIRTGIGHARDEIVCSIDCDCTYDPHELGRMIPLLTDGVDVVTASPYHPQGRVKNVPGWRLILSKSLSRIYRLVLHQSLSTYTSCFRVYRRTAVLNVDIHRGGFLGVAEMLGRLDLDGSRIVEYPTTLEVRVLGQSKMKVLKTIVGHLGLLADLARARIARTRGLAAAPDHF